MLHASHTVNMSRMTDTHVHMARVCLANILHNCNQQRLCVGMAQPNPRHLVYVNVGEKGTKHISDIIIAISCTIHVVLLYM